LRGATSNALYTEGWAEPAALAQAEGKSNWEKPGCEKKGYPKAALAV